MVFDPVSFWSPYAAQVDASGVPRRSHDADGERAALAAGRAVRWESRGDVLRLRGRDVVDLLHRIAASEVRDLPAARAGDVLFTTDKGRILDLPTLVAHDDAWLALCGRDQAAPLAAWLTRYVITEDVTVERIDDAHVLTLVRSDAVESTDGWVQGASRGAALNDASLAAWLRTNVSTHWTLVGEDAYRAWWIEQGRLTAGPELSSGLNPLEAGRRDVISWTKGCYIGQEVVARLDTYEKVKRRVVVLRGAAAWNEGDPLRNAASQDAGRVLAVAQVEGDTVIAMALVGKDVREGDTLWAHEAAGTVVKVPASL